MSSYKDKVISLEEALRLVKSNDQIFTGLGAAEAHDFLCHLHTIADRVKNVTLTNCLPMTDYPFISGKYRESFNVDGWFFSKDLRREFPNGNIHYIPNHLHLAAKKRLAHIHPNIYVGSASSVDEHGYLSLSMSNTYEKQIIKEADLVILEINPNFPVTYGDVQMHYSEVDYFIEADYPVPVLPSTVPNEKDRAIASLIAQQIHDGDTIQLGIGGIPNAIAEFLTDKKDLGVHTEMMTSSMAKLAQMGVINGRKKTLYPGKIVAAFILGTTELYEYVDKNPSVMVMDGGYVNDPKIIGLNDNMVSINTTVEVDLVGQCASETIGSRQISGSGGQADTAIGAQEAKNGRSFIALYSTARIKNKDGEYEEVSKIVPILKPGAVVTLSRNDVDRVVTEYGIAELRGTNVAERVERLIAIAHPKFREQLWSDARAYGLIA